MLHADVERGAVKVILGNVGKQHTGADHRKPDMTANDKLQITIQNYKQE